MATNLLLSGGPGHDFAATTASLVEVLQEVGVGSTVFDDPHEAFAALAAEPECWDLLTVNALRWRMDADRYAAARDRWAFDPRPGELAAVEAYVRGGGALLACHGAVICFDGDDHWRRCLGAAWDWNRSSHPPLGEAVVAVTEAGRAHPITAGLDGFTTTDEIYGFLEVDADVVPLATSAHGGADHPLVWARTVGRGRVVTDLLGHDTGGLEQPHHREILRRSARWLTSATDHPPAVPAGHDGSTTTP